MTQTTETERGILLQVARQSIASGLVHQRMPLVDVTKFPEPLQQPRATFVTLTQMNRLRGCVGSLVAVRPLVQDVAENACSAAFRDSRFRPLTQMEFGGYPPIDIHISILSESQPLIATDEEHLLAQLRPNIDGLIFSVLKEGVTDEQALGDPIENRDLYSNRSTFLPAVWQQLPDPKKFVEQLKVKAGMTADYWSDRVRVRRYTVEEF